MTDCVYCVRVYISAICLFGWQFLFLVLSAGDVGLKNCGIKVQVRIKYLMDFGMTLEL